MARKRRHRFTLVSTILLVIGLLFWQFTPAQAVFAIASLSDPAKLATLGERGANSRLNKIVYWLDEARRKGGALETTVDYAQIINGTREPRRTLVKESLGRNLKIADELGLLTAENRAKLRRGQVAIATRGPYQGEPVEIDHIVPFSLAPEAGNELANLEMLPKPLNRSKSAKVGPRQISHAQRLYEAKLLTAESLQRVRTAAK